MPDLRSSLRVSSRQLASALLWAALLGGVFAMHGLSTHGIGPTGDAPLAAVDHGQGAVHDAMSPSHPMPDGDHTGMAMLCLAILVAAIVVAWLDRFLRRRPLLTVPQLRVGFLPRPGTTHPPPLAHFSVMRC